MDQIVTNTPSNPSLRLPLIDMNKLVNPEFHEKELQKLHFACQEWGVLSRSRQAIRAVTIELSTFNMRS